MPGGLASCRRPLALRRLCFQAFWVASFRSVGLPAAPYISTRIDCDQRLCRFTNFPAGSRRSTPTPGSSSAWRGSAIASPALESIDIFCSIRTIRGFTVHCRTQQAGISMLSGGSSDEDAIWSAAIAFQMEHRADLFSHLIVYVMKLSPRSLSARSC